MLRISTALLMWTAIWSGASQAAESEIPEREPVPAIANARWEEYLAYYPTSELCREDEITLWTCNGETKTYSLCSSRVIDGNTGYIQYRAGSPQQIGFEYPEDLQHPKGIFQYTGNGNGDAAMIFRNGSYKYVLHDPLRFYSSIVVTRGPDETVVAEVSCMNPNQSLQLNYTLKLFRASGMEGP